MNADLKAKSILRADRRFRRRAVPAFKRSSLVCSDQRLSVQIRGYFLAFPRFAISSKYFAKATIPPDACCQSKFSLGA